MRLRRAFSTSVAKVIPIDSELRTRAEARDAADPLRRFREAFHHEPGGPVYLNGNSLGRMPLRAADVLARTQSEWSERLGRGWNEGWMDAPLRLGAKIAGLIGAEPDEVAIAESTSVNLYKLAHAALAIQAPRKKIVSDALNFPSDLYVLEGVARAFGGELEVVPSRDGIRIAPEDVEAAIDKETALLALTHTSFKTSALHDMNRLTAAAHAKGALALWDLSHSVGAVPTDLHGAKADLAVGCSYKYLNGGPGAPAFMFVRRELQEKLVQPIWGWLGHAEPFRFGLEYQPAEGIRRFVSGTPPVISMLAMEPGIDLIAEAGMAAIREKSIDLGSFLIELWEAWLEPLGVGLGSPRDASERGSHVSLTHPEGLAITLALKEANRAILDFRQPDCIRFGLAAVYNSFGDVFEAMKAIREVLETRSFEAFREKRVAVT